MTSRREEQESETGQDNFTLDKEALQPEMPRFDSYFESMSQEVHPFEKIKNNFVDSEIRSEEETAFA